MKRTNNSNMLVGIDIILKTNQSKTNEFIHVDAMKFATMPSGSDKTSITT